MAASQTKRPRLSPVLVNQRGCGVSAEIEDVYFDLRRYLGDRFRLGWLVAWSEACCSSKGSGCLELLSPIASLQVSKDETC